MRVKVQATLSWEFASASDDILAMARQQLNNIIVLGHHYEKFDIKLSTTLLKNNSKKQIAIFDRDEILPKIIKHKVASRPYFHSVGNQTYEIPLKNKKKRFRIFSKNPFCVVCGLELTKIAIERHNNSKCFFSFYGEGLDKRLILFTLDHIIPKSKAGSDGVRNLQTMCTICNSIKDNNNFSKEQIVELKALFDDPLKQDVFRQRREDMISEIASPPE